MLGNEPYFATISVFSLVNAEMQRISAGQLKLTV